MSSDGTLRADEQYCSTCGATIKKEAKLCPECGASNGAKSGSAGQNPRFCESCGEQIYDDTELCPSCGVRQQPRGNGGSNSLDVILYVFGALFILFGMDSLLDPTAEILWGVEMAVLLIGIGMVLFPKARQRYSRQHSLTTFGTVKTVERYPAKPGSCAVCQAPVSDGIRREYTEQFVLFGIVLSTNESGANIYCQTCAGTELGGDATADTTGVVSAEEPAMETSVDSSSQLNDRRE